MREKSITLLQLNPFMEFLESELQRHFEVVRWFELSHSEQRAWLAERSEDVEAIASGAHVGCPNELLDALPSLKIVSINGVGVDKVDLNHAAAKGVRVGTTVGGPTEDTADLAVGLTISLLREIPAAHEHVRDGKWPQAERPLAHKVTGRHFGIVGLGQIGSAVAARLAAFGPVSYTGPNRKDVPYEFVADLHELARRCDVLIVTCPANAATRHLIDAAVLEALGAN
ncbi:MAG: NAD(P)-dependent oxidoreductase, partial [Gammaproteobacteria bacterium]